VRIPEEKKRGPAATAEPRREGSDEIPKPFRGEDGASPLLAFCLEPQNVNRVMIWNVRGGATPLIDPNPLMLVT